MTRKEKKENCQIRASISLRFLSNDFNPQKKPHKKKEKKNKYGKATAFCYWLFTYMYVPESISRLSFETNKVSIVKVEVSRELELKVVASVAISGIVSDVNMSQWSNRNSFKNIDCS